MAELNLKQITDKLNSEFVGDNRKLIFWYDDNADFIEDIYSIELENAKVLHLEPDNQFYIKYFLECEDTTTNYLVYAPFAKPDIRDNHLADTIRYSKEFFADRASLLASNLGIDEIYKPVIHKYLKFFANKNRVSKFESLEIDTYNNSTIEVGIMSALCNTGKISSFEEVIRTVLKDGGLEENKFLDEFEKYGLMDAFWQHVDMTFGFNREEPTLKKFVLSMFITYATRTINEDIPAAWRNHTSSKSGTIIAFIDNLMNSTLYSDFYDELSERVYTAINGRENLEKLKVESLIDCNLFKGIDEIIINWMVSRLEAEDLGAKLEEYTIPDICTYRRKQHFGSYLSNEYQMIESAFYIISQSKYHPMSGIKNIVDEYTSRLFKVDSSYRYFYYYYDQIEDSSKFEELRDLVENIYTNEFLNKITTNWSKEFVDADGETGLKLQRRFYYDFIDTVKERTVVIISDALRYEVAYSLYDSLLSDEKCTPSITAVQGVLPSYTPLGMASLLPHNKLSYTEDYDVLVDDKACVSTVQRESILKEFKPDGTNKIPGICEQFDTIKNMKREDLRQLFTGNDVIYIYHNQIDARGDAANTENEVFNACEEAINEIHALIRKIATRTSTTHFIVTADHGFIYKREKLCTSDKISATRGDSYKLGQRYLLSDSACDVAGVYSMPLSKIISNDEDRFVSFPMASDIFKSPGAGQNFVHGGCSPQEMLVPVVDIKVRKGKRETSVAKINVISSLSKITNLITNVEFVQTEPVSDVVKETSYKIYFVDDNENKISNENILIADKKDSETVNRLTKLRFNFKNGKYDNSKKYYLLIRDEKNDMEVLRQEVNIDIAFADDFGF